MGERIADGPPIAILSRRDCCARSSLPWEMIQWQTVLGTGGYGLRARDVAMWLVWEQCEMSLREIGDFFGGLNYAAAAQRLRRLTS